VILRGARRILFLLKLNGTKKLLNDSNPPPDTPKGILFLLDPKWADSIEPQEKWNRALDKARINERINLGPEGVNTLPQSRGALGEDDNGFLSHGDCSSDGYRRRSQMSTGGSHRL
jgi:hypothetical protein